MGDPNGVGPRQVAKVLGRPDLRRMGLAVVGDREVLRRALSEEGVPLEVEPFGPAWDPAEPVARILEPSSSGGGSVEPGRVSLWAGRLALACVDLATDWCLEGKARAMVTAPLAKESVALSLPGFSGHTGHIARRSGVTSHCLSLVHGKMWAAFVTTHIALRDVSECISVENVFQTGALLREALVRSGVVAPRVGVAGLNPHAGEHGLFGDEERRVVEPAISRLREAGIDATGPWPADVVFPMLKAGQLDGVVSLYHDQGHPVMKTLAFDFRRGILRGVNATLGLPIVRTSPDHGTGFDIAWRKSPDIGSMVDALRLADRMARRK